MTRNWIHFCLVGLVSGGCALFCLTGCERPAAESDHASSGGDAAKHDDHDAAHVHTAPHGGSLVPLGDHVANIEFVLLKDEGRLTAYVLDAHAENPVRLPDPDLSLEITHADGKTERVRLDAVANALTGETVGDTSEYVIVADSLKAVETFSGSLPRVSVFGVVVENTAFTYPSPAQ